MPSASIDLLSMEDLVRAKKTQRDKDWPMIRRLLEQSYFSGESNPEFLLRQLRTPELLVRLATEHPEPARALAHERPAIKAALSGRLDEVQSALEEDQREEVRKDRAYWAPLKRELEELRLTRSKSKKPRMDTN